MTCRQFHCFTRSLYPPIPLIILVFVADRVLWIHRVCKIPLCDCCASAKRRHSPSGRSVVLLIPIHSRTADSFVGVFSFCSQWNGAPTRISCLGMYFFLSSPTQIPHRVVRFASCILFTLACVCNKPVTYLQCHYFPIETPCYTMDTSASTDTYRTSVDCRRSAARIPPAAG